MLLNCWFQFFFHLKLELLKHFPASNQDNMTIYEKFKSRILLFLYLPFQRWTVFIRQNLTYEEVKFGRLKSVSALKELKYF